MEQNRKRNLLNMTYYALVTLSILIGVIFMIYLATQTVTLYAKICYWIIADLIIGIVIFDIICTNIKKFKYIVGIILYITTLVVFALSVIFYITLSTNLILPVAQLFAYLAPFTLSYMMIIFTIILFNIGLILVENKPKRTRAVK